MPLQSLPQIGLDDENAKRRHRETTNNILNMRFDDWRKTTQEETNAGVTVVNPAFPPGDVRRYGAVLDGVADDTLPLNNALAANNEVFIPAGTLLITSAISVSDNQTIRGAGHNISTLSTSDNSFNAIEVTANARRVQLRNFAISSSGGVGSSNAAIFLDATSGCAQSTFEHLRITSFFDGIKYGDLFWDSTVRDVRCDSCTSGARGTGNAGTNIQVLWDRFYSQGHTTVGWQCAAVKNYTLLNCNFGGSTSKAVILAPTGAAYVVFASCNFESHTVAANAGVIEISSSGVGVFDNCTWAANAGSSATAYNLRVLNSGQAHVRNCVEIANGSNISSVRLENTAKLYKYDDGLANVTHATGSTATTITYSPYQARQLLSSPAIDLSGSAAQRLLYVPKRGGRVTRVAAIYSEATSSNTGVAVTVRSDDSVFTYATFTSHTSQALWDVQEITLSATAFTVNRPIIVDCAGGKTGTGEFIIALETTED